MLTAKQIADVIRVELTGNDSATMVERYEAAAEKIAALLPDNDAVLTASAALENEVTSVLMDMLAATILATLFEEEGGGRSNIRYSPMSMDHMMKHYTFTVENEGLVRTVRISLRPDSDLNDPEKWREPSNRHGVMHQDESGEGAKPQAEPKVYERPYWVVRYISKWGTPRFIKMKSREEAENYIRRYARKATIENRCCLHTSCPTTGCNVKPEVASGD